MSRGVVRICLLAAIAVICSAHVGTLDAFFAGKAGPYDVQVTVRPPGIVPGLAQITVRVNAEGVSRVTTQAAQWNVGSAGAPPPDVAKLVPGNPGLFSSELWLMTSGSYSVNVGVEGSLGKGIAVIPVASLATKRLPMNRSLGIALLGLAAFLFLGALTIIGASVRESVLPPGQAPDAPRRRRARVAVGLAALLFAAVLNGGWAWWNNVDASYAAGMYRPLHATAVVRETGGVPTLRVTIDDSTWLARQWSPLVPDHGKMMHLFLVRDSTLDTFAHLHPTFVDSSTFDAAVGGLPSGRYRFYADVVHESGLSQTLTGITELPSVKVPAPFSDADDAMHLSGGARIASTTDTLDDGARIAWQRTPRLVAGDDTPLRFTVTNADGSAAALEPYMGMPAHAMVARDDGSVFVHLHGMGSVSLVAQRVLEAVERGDTLPSVRRGRSPRAILHANAMNHDTMQQTGELAFPFAFPREGRYRIWVQVKRAGAIRTAAFDAMVEPDAAR